MALIPCLLTLTQLLLFVVPMPQHSLRGLVSFTSILRNWGVWEVFALALIGNRLSIALLGQFLLGDSCTLIDEVLRTRFPDAVPDGLCYGVQPVMMLGTWLIVSSAVLLVATSAILVGLGRAAASASQKLHRWTRPFVEPYYSEEREPGRIQ